MPKPTKPREHYTRVLHRMVAKILEKPQRLTVEDRWCGMTCTYVFQVMSLHVFGSYARGAINCGDLDVILYVRGIAGGRVATPAIKRAVFGRMPGIDVIVEQEGKWSFDRTFDEAQLVWSREQPDVAANLAAIVVQPEATRFQRKTDCFPVSLRQLQFHKLRELEALADEIDAGVYTSEWVPLESIRVDRRQWTTTMVQLEEHNGFGRKSTEILPYILQAIAERLDKGERPDLRGSEERASVHLGGFFARLGTSLVDMTPLTLVGVSTLILAPHLSKRYPSGLWLLRRGELHPMAHAFDGISAWLETFEGQPVRFAVDYPNDNTAIELHRDEQDVLNLTKQFYEQDSEYEIEPPLQLHGNELLHMLTSVGMLTDFLTGDDHDIVHTRIDALAAQLRGWMAGVDPEPSTAREDAASEVS